MPDIEDDDCLSCRVIGSVVPLALSGYVVNTWYKKVAPTGKLLPSAVYLTLAGGIGCHCGAVGTSVPVTTEILGSIFSQIQHSDSVIQ